MKPKKTRIRSAAVRQSKADAMRQPNAYVLYDRSLAQMPMFYLWLVATIGTFFSAMLPSVLLAATLLVIDAVVPFEPWYTSVRILTGLAIGWAILVFLGLATTSHLRAIRNRMFAPMKAER
jgi:hypothetical protein